jgi:iron complex outermembrane receptor protein
MLYFCLQKSVSMNRIFLSILLVYGFQLFGQSDTAVLSEVVLISTKTSLQDPFEANDLPFLFDPKNEKEAFTSIDEGLENISMIDLQQRGPMDIQADLSIRGGTFNQSLVLIDGVPYSDPQTGHHNMNLPFALNDIDRIEVTSGNSRLLGPQAFSGAVNFSLANDTGNYQHLQFFGGRYGLAGVYAKSGFKFDKHQFQIALNGSRSDGYLKNTDFAQAGAVLNGRFSIRRGEIKVFAATFDKAFGAQNFYSTNYPLQFENTRGWMGHVAFTKRSKGVVHRGFLSYRNHRDRFELFREADRYYSWVGDFLIMENDTAPDWYSGHNYHKSQVLSAEYSAEINWSNRLQSLIAVQGRTEGILSNILGDSIPESIPTSDGGVYTLGQNRTNGSLTINQNFESGKWKASVGVLVNLNTDYNTQWNPGFNLGYFVNENWKWVYSINRSFRIPTYTELYYDIGGAQGSLELLPESAWVQNLGTTLNFGNLKIFATLYHRVTQNGIDWLDEEYRIAASNISQIRFFGTDIQASFSWNKKWIDQLVIGYSHLNGNHNQESQSIYALRYLRHNLILNGSHTVSKSLRFYWTGRIQERYATKAEEQTSPFFTLALSLNYRTENNWSAQIRVQNATNSQYADRFGIEQPGIWPMLRIGKEF